MFNTKITITLATVAATLVVGNAPATAAPVGVEDVAVASTSAAVAPVMEAPASTQETGESLSSDAAVAAPLGTAVPPPPPVVDSGPVAQVVNPQKLEQWRSRARLCQDLQMMYEESIENAVVIDGNPDGQNQSDEGAAASDQQANQALADGKKQGCSWAA